jgi:hypothetical protein
MKILKGIPSWREGQILYPEHLKFLYQSLLGKVFGDNYGFLNFNVDKIAFSQNKLTIKDIEVIFKNGFYLNSSQQVTLDIGKAGKVYLCFDSNFYFNEKEVIYNSMDTQNIGGELISLDFMEPKLYLMLEEDYKKSNFTGLPIVSLAYGNRSFVCEEFLPPLLEIRQFDSLEKFIAELRNYCFITVEKSFINKDMKDLLKAFSLFVLKLESLYNSKQHPREVFYCLLDILSAFIPYDITIPTTINYDHCDVVKCCKEAINSILAYINKTTAGYSTLCQIKNGIFTSPALTYDKFKLLIELKENSNEAVDWILSARIYSESFYNDISQNRLLGIPRSIESQVGNTLIVTVDTSKFFKIKESLCIQNFNYELIKNISIVV